MFGTMRLYNKVNLQFCRFVSYKLTENLSKVKTKFNVVIIGGGHNGLVCAGYLQRAGLDVCVLERRSVVGGAAVTEEIIPGFKFSRASYVFSLFRPEIIHDLELKHYGLKVYRREPSSYTPLHSSLWRNGGPKSLTLGSKMAFNAQQIAQFDQKDAEAYEEYEALVCKLGYILDALIDLPPYEIVHLLGTHSFWNKLWNISRNPQIRMTASKLLKLSSNIPELYEFLCSPSLQILKRWFTSEPLIATLATDSVIGFMASPHMPGTGYVLLHHMLGELEGVRGAWGYPIGGMGAVTQSLAASAVAKGTQIFTDATVNQIKINSSGCASGVVLNGGLEINADLVISNATPKVTFLDLIPSRLLPEDFLYDVKNIDYSSPVTKINVAVDKLPDFVADPCKITGQTMPHHQCTIHLNCENSDKIIHAYEDAKRGRFSSRPMIEMVIPSSVDSSLAPPGCHVCLLFTQYTPYALADDRQWDEETKEEYANIVFDSIEEYVPGFKNSIVGKEVLTPVDLERIFGLTGGNIFHGAMSLHQLFLSRPTPSRMKDGKESVLLSDNARVLGSPLTPITHLLLCGSGAHPGGGVMGAPGKLAAAATLKVFNKTFNKS